MIVVQLAEYGVTQQQLSVEQGCRLAESGIVSATPSPYGGDVWDISAAGKVGVAQIGGVELRIAPKLAIDRLFFLLGYAIDPKGWRDEPVRVDAREDLVAAAAQALWRRSEFALRRGPIQGYRSVEETAPVLRGRLREADQLRRHHGRVLPVEIRYDDFTVDVAENQILLAAITRLLRVPRVDAESRRRLRHIRGRLAEVTTLIRGTALPAWHPSRLNEHYHLALRLAELIWRSTSPEHGLGSAAATGFIVDMPRLFEDFVTVAVRESAEMRHGGRIRPQYGSYLDIDESVRIKPDLVWEINGSFAAVLDAKYTQERPAGFPDADLYQMLAYSTALGLRRGHLIYAAGNAEGRRHVVRGSGTEIVCHTLDLSDDPARLIAQIDRLVDEVVRDGVERRVA